MRAVVHDRYGPPDVLRLEEVAQPVPRDDEVLADSTRRLSTGRTRDFEAARPSRLDSSAGYAGRGGESSAPSLPERLPARAQP